MSKRFIKLLTVAAALAIAGVAGATARGEVPSTVVRYGDLALNTKAGVVKLHARLRAAAEQVCSGIDSRALGLRQRYDDCVSSAVTDGVIAVGNENLSNYHRNRKVGLFAANRN
ncbi:MAG: UrcA family protein [Pseudomonadota bacterium]